MRFWLIPLTLILLVLSCAPRARQAAFDPTGRYDFTTQFMGQVISAGLLLEGEPGQYRGSVLSDLAPDMQMQATSVTVQERLISVRLDTPQGPMEIRFNVETDDTIRGNWSVFGQSSPIQGRRRPAS